MQNSNNQFRTKQNKRLDLFNFRIRASGAASIVGGTIGLLKGEKDHLIVCNNKRKVKKELIQKLEKEYQVLKNEKLVFPDVVPEPDLEAGEKILKAYQKILDSWNKKCTTIKTRQEKKIQTALDRLNKYKEKPALTDNQDLKEKAILEKQLDPMNLLPQGMKTYCEKWVQDQLYMRKKHFSVKETEKGNMVEQKSIDYINERLNLGIAFKNEEWFENLYMHGTPDVILAQFIIDAKNSYSHETFPLWTKELEARYFWQGIVYMALTGIRSYKVIFTLLTMPEELMEKEVNKAMNLWENRDKKADDIRNEIEALYTYDGLPQFLRLRQFPFEFDQASLDHLVNRIELCQQYIDEVLLPDIPQDVIDEISAYSGKPTFLVNREKVAA